MYYHTSPVSLFDNQRFDYDDDGDIIYIGRSHPLGKENEPCWCITKLEYITVNDKKLLSSIKIAEGSLKYNLIWDLRDTYKYGEISEPMEPIIYNTSFNESNQHDNAKYKLIITAVDPLGLPLTYLVKSSRINDVTITQDVHHPHIFYVTYGDLGSDQDITFNIIVQNNANKQTFQSITQHVTHI